MISQYNDGGMLDIKNEKNFSFVGKAVLFFLFLASLNFLNRFAYCVFIAFAVFLVLENRNIKVSIGVLPLIIFSLSLLVFWNGGNSSITAMLRTMTFPICFVMGYSLLPKKSNVQSREFAFKTISVILALGTWLHLMLNLIINFSNEEAARNTIDFWIGDVLAATGQAALASLIIPVAVSWLFSNNKIWVKIFAVVALLATLYYNLILAGRSIFILLIVALVVALFHYLSKSNNRKSKLMVFSWVTLAIIVCIIIYNQNVFNIKEVVEDSNFYERFFGDSAASITEDGRGERKLKYLAHLVEYPFGGSNIREIVDGYAHDLYLDTYDDAGFIALFAIVAVVIDFAVKTVKVLKNKMVSFETKQMLLCIFVVLNVVFWMEPILAGMAWLLACFCIIYGSVCRLEATLRINEGNC